MATQQTLIAETIRGMKAALRRTAYDSDSDSPAAYYTNRGNKLKRAARFVHEGRLDTTGGSTFRKRVNHNGYQRHILHENPLRYDDDGDPLDDLDEDEEDIDASPNEENPFGETRLEYLLAPLTSAAELSEHPSLAAAYTNNNITEMAERAREMLHYERGLLVKLKTLLLQFRGDALWAPLGSVETAQDTFLLDDVDIASVASVDSRTELSVDLSVAEPIDTDMPDPEAVVDTTENAPSNELHAVNGIQSVDMAVQTSVNKQEENNDTMPSEHGQENGTTTKQTEPQSSTANGNTEHETGAIANTDVDKMDTDQPGANNAEGIEGDEDDQPSHAMTTRAKARTPPTGEGSPRSAQSSPTTYSTKSINGFFLPAATSIPDRDFGIPVGEAEDTRRVLILYVQKQEEIVRGTEQLMMRLLEADRKRKDVWRWCKAEGHVGELSDGEDWYDLDEWGLETELSKGREEEDVEDDKERKGRRRRENARKPGAGNA